MKLDPFTDALVRLVHCYYPPGIDNDDPRYEESEEGQRLTQLLLANQQLSPTWKRFTAKVGEAFPGCSVWDATVPMHEPCNIIRVSLPDPRADHLPYNSVVGLLSQLAPVCALYASHHTTRLSRRTGGKAWWRFAPLSPRVPDPRGEARRAHRVHPGLHPPVPRGPPHSHTGPQATRRPLPAGRGRARPLSLHPLPMVSRLVARAVQALTPRSHIHRLTPDMPVP